MTITDAKPRQRPARQRRWWRTAALPLALVTATFLAFSLPPYLGLDPDASRLELADNPILYPALVVHIFAGTVLLLCAVLQLWPWLRQHHLNVHRWSGRTYVVAAIPVAVGGLIVAQFPHGSEVQQVGNTMLALLFAYCTYRGYRAVRSRRIPEHREWMVRSFALAFSIVINRVWLIPLMMLLAPDGAEGPGLTAAIDLSTWLSWTVNLLLAEWWLERTRRRTRAPRPKETA